MLQSGWQYYLSMLEEGLSNILIKGGRVIDPKTEVDDILDILITGNKISKIGKKIKKNEKVDEYSKISIKLQEDLKFEEHKKLIRKLNDEGLGLLKKGEIGTSLEKFKTIQDSLKQFIS